MDTLSVTVIEVKTDLVRAFGEPIMVSTSFRFGIRNILSVKIKLDFFKGQTPTPRFWNSSLIGSKVRLN